jgi:D-sedoheptulose 7-phosphate isomerase
MLTSDELQAELAEVSSLLALTGRHLEEQICDASRIVVDAVSLRRTLLFAGNGGSASQAIHLAAEFVGRFKVDTAPYPALALCDNVASLTAIANDYSYEEVFSRQVRAFGRAGDVLVLLSTSGLSANVVEAAITARELGLKVIAMCGSGGGRLKDHAHVSINVPSSDVAHVQEVHIVLGHLLCAAAERVLVNATMPDRQVTPTGEDTVGCVVVAHEA